MSTTQRQPASTPRRIPFADLTEESIRCRAAQRHDWKPSTAEHVVGAWLTVEVCAVCGSERHSTLSNTGHVMDRHIRYAEGYLSKFQLTGEDRDRMRLLVLEWDYGVKVAS